MKPVYIVRHGQTEFNVAGKAQGWKDSPLTRTGIMQGMQLKSWLNKNQIYPERIYTSDLGRAVQTASLLADRRTMVLASPGLREISFGDLDGCDSSAFNGVNWDEAYEQHGGESFEQAVFRVWRTLMQILGTELHDSATDPTIIVTHGAILKGIYQLLDKDPNQSWEEFPEFHNCETLICQLDENTGKLMLTGMWQPQV